MLCDEILAEGVPGTGCDISCLIPTIRASQKFVLSAECAAVADSLASDYTGLVKAFPHCRLPFPQTWIEFAANERPMFSKAKMYAPEFQAKPRRIGFLLTASRPDLSAWKAHLFWSIDNEGCNCPLALAMEFDMLHELPLADGSIVKSTAELNTATDKTEHPGWYRSDESVKLAMINHSKPTSPDYEFPKIPRMLSRDEVIQLCEAWVQLSRSDWAGEPAYMLAVIGLLNARNATETETVIHHKLNRARVKRGKPPLLEHKVLKIARRQQRHYATDTHGNHAHARGHFVMGHWKIRKTGIYFWGPHARGDFTRGKIEKTYEVTE